MADLIEKSIDIVDNLEAEISILTPH